jgi:hypothetical protein
MRGGPARLSPHALYPLVQTWLQALELPCPPLALEALAHLVLALLTAHSRRPSALMRALLSPTPVPARQRDTRVARFWERPWLTPAWLTPYLVRAVLALVPPAGWGATAGLSHVVLDSVRCGPWEVCTLGLRGHGRLVPLSWAVRPSPWPKGQVTPTVCALLRRVGGVWPDGRPAHRVADRAFPSHKLVRTLRALQWGWTVRLRAPRHGHVDSQDLRVRALLARARATGWSVWRGAYGWGAPGVPATLVVGRGRRVLPRHQRTVGTQRHRARRQAERQRVKAQRYAAVAETDAWMVLCTTHPTWEAAVRRYRGRWATAGSYRDAQSGWDGQHGWDLEPVLRQARSAGQVERIVGLWALGTLLQTWLGSQVAQGPAAVQAVAAQWTTTGRLSVWAQGQCARREPLLAAWLPPLLLRGAQQLAAAAQAGAVPPHARAA